jgi:integron integrase
MLETTTPANISRPGPPAVPPPATSTQREPKLLDRLRAVCRAFHYSLRTEDTYHDWCRRFILFHGKRHPKDMAEPEVNAFLTHLAVDRHVSASTQNQALASLLFLYQHVLGRPLNRLEGVVRAFRPRRLPVVLTRTEVHAVLDALEGTYRLMGRLMYGSGLRQIECLRLRVKDLDFEGREVTVREGKGNKDRRTTLPGAAVPDLRAHLEKVRRLHAKDTAAGYGRVELPYAFAAKQPWAAAEWRWQYVFPSSKLSRDPRGGEVRRHHAHETAISKAVTAAARQSGVLKRVTCHTFRHSFATHLLESGYDIRTVQELLGHDDVSTTMVYTHVLNKGGRGVRSPLDE